MRAGRSDPRFGLVLARRVTSRSRIRPNPSDKPGRLQAVQNVFATVVDIGAKTDYDASDPDVELKRACCHGGPTRVNKRTVFPYSGEFYQCHINLIRKPRSIGYRGHGII